MSKERKSDHIRISLEEEVESGKNGFEDISLIHNALPEVSLDHIELKTEFLGKKLKYPFLIEAMTGGTEEAMAINEALAHVAGQMGIGIEVGSQRPAIEDKKLEETYSVIKEPAKNTLKIANVGAVQLNYNYGITECQMAVDMIGADALALHLNALQEVIQPEGDVNFSDLLPKIRDICGALSVPVIVKEVGCGISSVVAEKLLEAGVKGIDIGGYGGTSWNRIEGFRAEGEKKEISEIFDHWGIPTAYSLLEIKDSKCPKIASGGIRDGIEAAKAIAMGGDLIGLALPLLRALDDNGEDGVYDYLYQLADELKVAMFLTGSKDVGTLKKIPYKVMGKAREWMDS
jgi:isopentenyl-diphosphate delta-isomerase